MWFRPGDEATFHRLMCEGTLEERIAAVLAHKRQLAGPGAEEVEELADDAPR